MAGSASVSDPEAASSSRPRLLDTTPLERYFARDTHGTGMVFSITLILRGDVDVQKIRNAWFETLAQNPRVHATLIGRGRRQKWKLEPTFTELAFTETKSTQDQLHRHDIQVHPRLGCGARCVVANGGDQNWQVRMAFHHACCDGVGAIRLIGRFLKRYAAAVPTPTQKTNQPISRLGVSYGSLSKQPAITQPIPDLRNLWTTIRGRNVRLRGIRATAPTALAAGTAPPPPAASAVGSHGQTLNHSLTVAQSRQIHRFVKSKNATLNDWGLSLTLQTLSAMTRNTAANRYVMVMNPVELRTFSQRHASHNHVGIAFVRRTHDQLRDQDETLRSVSDQMTSVRLHETSHEMEVGISVAERIPGCLDMIERLGTFTPTAAFTCMTGLRLGERLGVRRDANRNWIGPIELIDLIADAPLQAGGELSVAMWEFDGHLVVSCRTDTTQIPPTVGERFLSRWLHQIDVQISRHA